MDELGHHQVRNQHLQQQGDVNQQQPQNSQGNQQPSNSGGKWYYPSMESKVVVILIILASIVVLATFMASLFARSNGLDNFVKNDQYQAVFLSNGQVYFGQITGANNGTMVLEDVYYLQVDQQIQPEQDGSPGAGAQGTNGQPQVSLAKLGGELHGPEDQMFISTSEIVFWENLSDSDKSQVVNAIERHKESGGEEGVQQQTPEENTDTTGNENSQGATEEEDEELPTEETETVE